MPLHYALLRATVIFMPPTTSHRYGVWTALRVIRTKDGQSLTDLHNATGISLSHLSDMENGRRLPTVVAIKKIAKALNCPVSVLERDRNVDENGVDIALVDLVRQLVREELRGTAA